MTEPRESRLWLVVGCAFAVGGTALLAADFQNWLRTGRLDAEGFKIGIFCSLILLAGVIALLAWRIFRNLESPPLDHGRIFWLLLARIGTPAGAIWVEYEWGKTMSMPTTFNQKAALMAGGFLFIAGLLSLMGERVIHHIRHLVEFHSDYAPASREVPQGAEPVNPQ
jgi:hypothetical protein